MGAGPAGSSAAKSSAEKGAKTLLLEEHENAGFPPHCAGLITIKGLDETGVRIPKSVVQNKAEKIKLFFNRSSVIFPLDVLIVDRPKLDQYLANMALNAGAELWFKSKAVSIYRSGKLWRVVVKKEREVIKIPTKIVIGADGFRSMVAKWTGLKHKKELAICIQYELEAEYEDLKTIECYFVGKIAPGGYAWVVPFGKNLVRVGLGVRNAKKPAKYYLDKLISKRFRSPKINSIMGGCVPISGPMRPSYSDGVLIAGDAAGQVNPILGTGILSSIVCGSMAGKVAAEAIKCDNTSASKLEDYENMWVPFIGELYTEVLNLRKDLESMTIEERKRVSEAIKRLKPGIRKMELAKAVLKALSTKPKLLKYMAKIKLLRRAIYI